MSEQASPLEQHLTFFSSRCVGFTPRLLRRHQVKYKEEGKKEASVSLYSLMADTLETQQARGLTDMLSEVGEPPSWF